MSVNAKNNTSVLLLLVLTAACHASPARDAVRKGNELYSKKDWQGAITAYEKAVADEPGAIAPKFNKANALFKSGDFAAATDAYRQVAAESREIDIVAKAKYNLGNCFFEEGIRQKDSDLQKSIDSLQESIQNWRANLEIDPHNQKALRNIETAKLVIKSIMDEQKKRQEQQQQDPNSTQKQDSQQQGDQGQQQQQQQDKQGQDPNDPNQPGQQQEPQKQDEQKDGKQEEKKEEQKAEDEQLQKAEEKKEAPDATAEQILRDEQDRKRQLQPGQQPGYVPVEQDW